MVQVLSGTTVSEGVWVQVITVVSNLVFRIDSASVVYWVWMGI